MTTLAARIEAQAAPLPGMCRMLLSRYLLYSAAFCAPGSDHATVYALSRGHFQSGGNRGMLRCTAWRNVGQRCRVLQARLERSLANISGLARRHKVSNLDGRSKVTPASHDAPGLQLQV